MTGKTNSNFRVLAALALGLSLIVAVSTCIGVYTGLKIARQDNHAAVQTALQLKAGTAARSKSLSMATGMIDDEVEGLYILDHVAGNLQCWVLNARTGAVGGVYTTNILEDLGPDKTGEPDYVMTTGNFFWSGGNAGNMVPSQSVCYIADGTSGNVVGYSFTFDRQGIRRGIAQEGLLTLVCKGPARETVVRDQ